MFLGRFRDFLSKFQLKKRSKNGLFSTFQGIFGVKSVPNVPPVSLVPWYSINKKAIV
jgi:hypothetical protein